MVSHIQFTAHTMGQITIRELDWIDKPYSGTVTSFQFRIKSFQIEYYILHLYRS